MKGKKGILSTNSRKTEGMQSSSWKSSNKKWRTETNMQKSYTTPQRQWKKELIRVYQSVTQGNTLMREVKMQRTPAPLCHWAGKQCEARFIVHTCINQKAHALKVWKEQKSLVSSVRVYIYYLYECICCLWLKARRQSYPSILIQTIFSE